jgi:hypothetical protein
MDPYEQAMQAEMQKMQASMPPREKYQGIDPFWNGITDAGLGGAAGSMLFGALTNPEKNKTLYKEAGKLTGKGKGILALAMVVPAIIFGAIGNAVASIGKKQFENAADARDMMAVQLNQAGQILNAQQMELGQQQEQMLQQQQHLTTLQHEAAEHRKKFTETITPKVLPGSSHVAALGGATHKDAASAEHAEHKEHASAEHAAHSDTKAEHAAHSDAKAEHAAHNTEHAAHKDAAATAHKDTASAEHKSSAPAVADASSHAAKLLASGSESAASHADKHADKPAASHSDAALASKAAAENAAKTV